MSGFEFGDLDFQGREFGFQRLEHLGFDFPLLRLDPALFLAVHAGNGLARRGIGGRSGSESRQLGRAFFVSLVFG